MGFLSSKLEEQRFAKLLVIGHVSSRVEQTLLPLGTFVLISAAGWIVLERAVPPFARVLADPRRRESAGVGIYLLWITMTAWALKP